MNIQNISSKNTTFKPTAGILALLLALIILVPATRADIEVDPGDILVANVEEGILMVDPDTGAQTQIACLPGTAFGVTQDADGDLIVTDRADSSVKRIERTTGAITPISMGDGILRPTSVAIDSDGDLIVTNPPNDFSDLGNVLHIDSLTGEQQVINDSLHQPFGIAIDFDGDLIVTSTNDQGDGSCCRGSLMRVDPSTGDATLIRQDPNGGGDPVDVVIDASGNYLVSDSSAGNIHRVTPDGFSTLIANGIEQARGLALDTAGSLVVAAGAEVKSIWRVDALTGNKSIVSQGGMIQGIELDVATVAVTFPDADDDGIVDSCEPGIEPPPPLGEGSVILPLVSGGELLIEWHDVIFPETHLAGQDVYAQAIDETWTVTDTTQTGAGWHVTLIADDHLRGDADQAGHVIELGVNEGFTVSCLDTEIVPVGDTSDPPTCPAGAQAIPVHGEQPLTMIWADGTKGMGVFELLPHFEILVPGTAVIDRYTTDILVDITVGP